MQNQIDDATVIGASLEEPARFAAIFDRHFDSISHYLRSRAGADVGEDLAAQTFLVAFDRRATYDTSRSSARPWLFGIAANLLHRRRRDEARALRGYRKAAERGERDALEGITDQVDAVALRPRLVKALSSLSRDEREALLLYALAELSYAEIAEALDVPIGTVRSRIARARGRLQEPLERLRAIDE